MTRYTACGKQVKRGSEHVADAADETWAQIITDALNGEREHRGKAWNDAKTRLMGFDGPECVMYPYQREALRAMRIDPIRVSSYDYATEPDKTVHMQVDGIHRQPSHIWQRQQDEYACSCGARWDVSDGDEHPPTR